MVVGLSARLEPKPRLRQERYILWIVAIVRSCL
jgi:hypothetical protein